MKHAEKDFILDKLSVIKNLKGIDIGRAASLVWITFKGDKDLEYALHLQTYFRFRTNDEVLVVSGDMYEPSDAIMGSPSFDWETFHWDLQGFNRFDVWVKKFNKQHAGKMSVIDADMNLFGDLLIYFDNGIVLEVFSDLTCAEEIWRFFEKCAENHLVVTGQGLEE